MLWIMLGCAAFVLFFLYDIAGATGRFYPFRIGFAARVPAAPLLHRRPCLAGTVGEAYRLAGFFIFTLLAFLFLVLLVYTLFFALPFHDTYLHGTTAPSLCRSGVYALCRHPGVLWLSGFYLCLYAALGTRMLLAAFVVFTLFDIAYVVFQDRWSFPKQFPEYDDYRQSTPFLLPNVRSIRQCVRTWRGTGDGSHEV